jgi:hypothetical protein
MAPFNPVGPSGDGLGIGGQQPVQLVVVELLEHHRGDRRRGQGGAKAMTSSSKQDGHR